MAWILRNSGDEERYGKVERVAAQRIRMYIWKQWKPPKTRVENLMKLGMPDWMAFRNGNTRKGYWAIAGSGILSHTITNERLARRQVVLRYIRNVQVSALFMIEPTCTERYARWCVRTDI